MSEPYTISPRRALAAKVPMNQTIVKPRLIDKLDPPNLALGPIVFEQTDRPLTATEVVSVLCTAMAVPTSLLGQVSRHGRTVLCREMCAILLRKHTLESFPVIARAIGKKNHSTVITAHKRTMQAIAECAPIHKDAIIPAAKHVQTYPEAVAWCEAQLAKRFPNLDKRLKNRDTLDMPASYSQWKAARAKQGKAVKG